MRRVVNLALALSLPLTASVALASPPTAPGVTPDMVQTGTDIVKNWKEPHPGYNYIKREVMIPMRDGVKLHTVILIPKGAHNAPILMERTPYNASQFVKDEPGMRDATMLSSREYVDAGFIMVYQDVRGKYGSEGNYVMTRPSRGPLNPTDTDETTDSYDTVAWLVNPKNLPQSNGNVGLIGSSYDGMTVAAALLHPHPAVKAAIPESPMIDGWMGDDWYHYGAFRECNLEYFTFMTTKKGTGDRAPRVGTDDYWNFLEAGSAGDWAKAHGYDQMPWWNRMSAHPAYDAFWQLQALDKQLAKHPSNVPTMWLQGLWDQEDMYGAIHSWEALTKAGHAENNHLVMGPWFHSQINRSADHIGPIKLPGDTAGDFRKNVMVPFFQHYLEGKKGGKLPSAMIYNPSEKRWDSFKHWKTADSQKKTPIYLHKDFGLGFEAPQGGSDSYVSDPAKPVPFMTPPVDMRDHPRWTTWLLDDQRPAATRTDVLSYSTPVLTKAVTVKGAPFADIFAKTTGTDGDFVVKIIDVYPQTYGENPKLSGYELPVSMDIFRGRYRKSFSDPSPIPAGKVQEYKFRLPTMNYVFQPGHKIMIQIQSSWFPLYDRNPQTYVKNILFAKKADYKKATVTIEHGKDGESAVLLPVVK